MKTKIKSHKNPLIIQKILALQNNFYPASEYNGYLFNLYHTYLTRYYIEGGHLKQAIRLKALLEDHPWPAFCSWSQIIICSQELKFNPLPRSSLGCPIRKIGYMLQELGTIPPFTDESAHWNQKALQFFNPETQTVITQFIQILIKTKRTASTIRNYLITLKHLQTWLDSDSDSTPLWQIHLPSLERHLKAVTLSHPNFAYRRNHFQRIRKFLRWCKFEGKILHNPCDAITMTEPARRLTICSPEQIKKLFKFIQSPGSNPQEALLVTLTMIFGLTSRDLILATLQPNADSLNIILDRQPLSFHRKRYNRPEVLKLPGNPLWFLSLQKSFYRHWSEQYSKVKKTYPRYSLILPKHLYYNRPISREWIRKQFLKITHSVAGTPMTASTLRKTCGHLHSITGDASILASLGWSRDFAFAYTWLPRQYVTPKK
ncbi:MAG: hypothetical protein ABIQ95_08040 [Bdellovibrionia bacterium]